MFTDIAPAPFPVEPELATQAAYEEAYSRSLVQPEAFWAEIARTYAWQQPPAHILRGDFARGEAEWFAGGRTNLAVNCLDRHLPARSGKAALLWEPSDPAEPSRALSYRQLHAEVCRLANALTGLGIGAGDRVCIYMPMVPETAIAMLACARIGAIHSVVFAGFSAASLAGRIADSGCRLLLTADGARRGASETPLKAIVDEALALGPNPIEKVVVLRRTGAPVPMADGRDIWWHTLLHRVPADHVAPALAVEDPLFILYTSGSTGKPKGIVHALGGYMAYVGYTARNVFQLKESDVFWCTADLGWITGHSYALYGALLNGATTLLFEGTPTWPDARRWWQVAEKHGVTIFYTAPTAIRSLMALGSGGLKGNDLSCLRVLGTVGEPINEEAWHWLHAQVGGGQCPVADTYWQTETGGIAISTLAGVTPHRPAWATRPLPGIAPALRSPDGRPLEGATEGHLVFTQPWPGLARTTWGDAERFRQTYFATHPGVYFTGDGARRDEAGDYRILGRTDDVLNVSGHRIGTAELENAICESGAVVECAVVGYPHPVKGEGIYAFVVPAQGSGRVHETTIVQAVRAAAASGVGPFARPDVVQVAAALPKTRSGKIMRRILRKLAEGTTTDLGDTSTLLDPSVVQALIEGRGQAA